VSSSPSWSWLGSSSGLDDDVANTSGGDMLLFSLSSLFSLSTSLLLRIWPLLLLLALVMPNKRSILIDKNQGHLPQKKGESPYPTLQLPVATTFVLWVGWRPSTVIFEALEMMKTARSSQRLFILVGTSGFGVQVRTRVSHPEIKSRHD
jgi:hypothetical protein